MLIKEGKRGKESTWKEKQCIVEWLEMPPGTNFKIITGSATSNLKTVVSGTKLKKTHGYASLAEFLNERCGTN
jgi:hypothetical protein